MSFTLPQTQFPLLTSSIRKRSLPSGQHHRPWKRRHMRPLTLHNQLNPSPSPFDNLFHSLIVQFSSVNALDYIAPTIGLVSGLTLYFSSKSQKLLSNADGTKNFDGDIGEWILFTSPTPFNRFVTLRCPSIHFQGSELLENVNEKLLEEDIHFVRLSSGRMLTEVKNDAEFYDKLVYQRICLSTEDGGVVSLDWPADLDLEEEGGLDTTVLIIPGTPEGSNEGKIRDFVCDCLKTGLFPVVVNPRGCAGSPVTTARLFTAADSDDISTAIDSINKARPRTKFMAVGWGYGANMLTKYLAEVGENTPLTAATCIDNPFDLEEATRTSMYHIDFDRRFTNGLISILYRNKELFQGHGKGFEVDRGLSASSVQDFEKAVSMVSYGFDSIEDFYAKSSTRYVVGKVKIPVLFIQNDDGTAPLFSIPRSSIAENPYTSLLLCSYSPPSKVTNVGSTFSRCQLLIIEWLTAVELGLLKGRHPLLEDVDVNIRPSKGLPLLGGRAFGKTGRRDKLLNVTNTNTTNSVSPNFLFERLEENHETASIQSKFGKNSREPEPDTKRVKHESSGLEHQSNAVNAEVIVDGTIPVDNERGQVLQAAPVVLNMLDVTSPGTLSEEQKKKVLSAVGQGETLMKALQDAVPEDVREKLTEAVSVILQSQGSNLNLEGLLNLGQISNMAAGFNSKVVEKSRPLNGEGDDGHSSDQKKRINHITDGSGKVHRSDPSGFLESELESSENTPKAIDTGQFHSSSTQTHENAGSENIDLKDSGNIHENAQFPVVDAGPSTDNGNVQETSDGPELSNQSEGPGSTEDIVERKKVESDSVKSQDLMDQENNKQKIDSPTNPHKLGESSQSEDESFTTFSSHENQPIEKDLENNQREEDGCEDNKHEIDFPAGQCNVGASSETENNIPASSSSSENQLTDKDVENKPREEDSGWQPVSNVDTDRSSRFSVSRAIDALSGFDDSTQVAVNSVFNVIKDIIDQFEVENESESEEKDRDNQDEANREGELMDSKEVSLLKYPYETEENKLEKVKNSSKDHSRDSPKAEETKQHTTFSGDHSDSSWSGDREAQFGKEKDSRLLYPGEKLQSRNLNEYFKGGSQDVPSYLTAMPYRDDMYTEYLKTYLISKLKSCMPQYFDTPSALLLDYIPEEGRWKLLDQEEDNDATVSEITVHQCGNAENHLDMNSKHSDIDGIIEPSYAILDAGKQHKQDEDCRKINKVNGSIGTVGDIFDKCVISTRNIIIETLNIEVNRRTGAADMEELEPRLAEDVEHVANAVSQAVRDGKVVHDAALKSSALCAEAIVQAISSALKDTGYLSRVLPVGLVVGTSLAALRKFFDVVAVDCNGNDNIYSALLSKTKDDCIQEGDKETNKRLLKSIDQNHGLETSVSECTENMGLTNTNGKVMVGAVTAAFGASALLAHHHNTETAETSIGAFKEKESSKHLSKPEETIVKTQNNIVTSLAEKAMSVASHVVPTKENGEVDHERLVAMLAELRQKGGILKLVGKVALLWGGIRGAMSLADKLISFLRIAERPLIQRTLGFVFMVLLLWSPVVIPLLPTLMQSWATRNPFKVAELACIAGLYGSIMIMIPLWGKRIRNYDDPLREYGMDLFSMVEFKNFLMGLLGGVMLVLLIQSANFAIGCVQLCWPATLCVPSSDPVALVRVCVRVLMLIVRGLVTASAVAVVEELLFRSWLPQEIAADLGYHHGIIISGLIFSLCQRSLWEIPGLWLLSLILSGAQQRSQGSLSLPIGIHSGMLASSFILKTGGFLKYQPNFPLWATGGHPFQPFSGIVGLTIISVLAIVFYPRQSPFRTIRKRLIRE